MAYFTRGAGDDVFLLVLDVSVGRIQFLVSFSWEGKSLVIYHPILAAQRGAWYSSTWFC